MEIWAILLIIFGSILLLFLIALFFIYMFVFYAPKQSDFNIPKNEQYDLFNDKMIELIKDIQNIPYEDVYVATKDGKTLHGRYYKLFDTNEVAICFHGYRGTAVRDFSGGAHLVIEKKQNFILVDQRGQGKSSGKFMSFGIKEREDVETRVTFVNQLYENKCKIYLYGVSLGAATILMSASKAYENVVCFIADSPYSSPKDIIQSVMKQMKLPVKVMYWLVYLSALIYGHFNLHKYNAIDEVKNCKIPILIIHGDDDRIVPVEMSKKIAEANKKYVKLEIFKDAAHALSYLYDEEKYKKCVNEFLKNYLSF